MARFRSSLMPFHSMPNKQFESRLRQNFDMVIFSQLLEMDHEENRLNSYITLYACIAEASNAIYKMKRALFKKDISQLQSICDDVQHKSKGLGMYRITQSFERALVISTKLNEEAGTKDHEHYAVDFHMDGVFTSLEESVTSACAALDAFYAAT